MRRQVVVDYDRHLRESTRQFKLDSLALPAAFERDVRAFWADDVAFVTFADSNDAVADAALTAVSTCTFLLGSGECAMHASAWPYSLLRFPMFRYPFAEHQPCCTRSGWCTSMCGTRRPFTGMMR